MATRPPGFKMRKASATARSGCWAWCRDWLKSARSTVPLADGQVFQVAVAVVDVSDAVLTRQFATVLDHLLGIVDGDHLLRALAEQLGDGAFACAQIGDHVGRHQLQKRFGEPFPGAAGNILAAEFARERIEMAAHVVLALAQDQTQGAGVVLSVGSFGGSRRERSQVVAAMPGSASAGRKSLLPVRRSSTKPACLSWARCVEMWL